MSVDNKNGKYPKMQNPGVPGIVEEPFTRIKRVLLINGATIANPNGFDQKVMLYPNGVLPPTQDEEEAVIAETTFPFFDRRILT